MFHYFLLNFHCCAITVFKNHAIPALESLLSGRLALGGESDALKKLILPPVLRGPRARPKSGGDPPASAPSRPSVPAAPPGKNEKPVLFFTNPPK
jgi:hypothetical protein